MKILHISTQDSGGAGIAVHRLHLGLKAIGEQSKMLVLHSFSSDDSIVKFTQNNNILKRMWNKVLRKLICSEFNAYKNTRPEGLEIFTDDRSVYDISKHPLVKEADVIQLHWVAGMVNYIEFFANIINKPIVWTLHDMNPFTGGCHYSGGCKKYETGCSACPQLGSNTPNDLSKKIFKKKEKSYKNCSIHIVTPSKWLANCAKQSQLFKRFKVSIIPNGLSTSMFVKRDKQFSRELFNLPQDKILILFGAQSAANGRKGVSYLIDALKVLHNKVKITDIALVIFGSFGKELHASLQGVGFPFYLSGVLKDELLLSACYSAADIFVLPSLEDNLPNTILESMSCGTAIVGFDTGGIPDMIKPNLTGLLAKTGDIQDLAEKIQWMIAHSNERIQMGKNARKITEQEFTLDVQAKKYVGLYQSLL